MHIWKSGLIVLFLIALFVVTIWQVIRLIFCFKWSSIGIMYTSVLCVFTALNIIGLWEYTIPFEQYLEPELFTTCTMPSEYSFSTPPTVIWHAIYKPYGLYAGARYYDEEETMVDWPEMNLDQYTYIACYGKTLVSLSFNVWETIDIPIRTGAKVGHAVLSEEYDPTVVYIYKIPRMRIDIDF